jgi:hypothetical protein
MDALSLSHLTHCCATITVNFHRLDHPPFPCKSRLLLIRIVDKCLREHGRRTSGTHIIGITTQERLASERKGFNLHEGSHNCWNTSHRPWHHRICYRRNLLHPPEEGCRRRSDSDLPQDPGYPSDLADSEHDLASSWCWSGCGRSESTVGRAATVIRRLLIFRTED